MNVMHTTLALLLGCSGTVACAAPLPETVAAPGQALVATLEAEGAQVYQCQPDAGGKLVWTFREPIATLLLDGKTVGRHYAGPVWSLPTAATSPRRSLAARRLPPRRTFRCCVSRCRRSAARAHWPRSLSGSIECCFFTARRGGAVCTARFSQ